MPMMMMRDSSEKQILSDKLAEFNNVVTLKRTMVT
jgi:hypothetical protein